MCRRAARTAQIFRWAILLSAVSFTTAGAAPEPPVAVTPTNAIQRFFFGPAKPASGWTQITPEQIYSSDRGCGFEPGAAVTAVGGPEGGAITSDRPFYFSQRLPEGNYRITVTLGGGPVAAETTVNAELRRLMLERVPTGPGQVVTRQFIVNVRQPAIASGGEVRLTAREKETERRSWDDRLTLEFLGRQPTVARLEIVPVTVPTVFLAGDSTVCDQPAEPYNSWGQMITRCLQPTVAIANHAESGESIAGALAKGRFNKIWSQLKPGDYLIIQFGHNDMKSSAANALDNYTDNLRKVVTEARRRGGIPLLCTPVSRRSFGEDGKIKNSFGGYPEAVRLVARDMNVALIDLQQMGAAFYEALGPEGSHQAFATARENTHHSDYGSYEIARCVLQSLRDNHVALANHILPEFATFDPAHPDPITAFKVPASAGIARRKPAGN